MHQIGGFDMSYMAPSKFLGEFLGVKLHHDWGLTDHSILETTMGMPWGDIWVPSVARLIVSQGPERFRDLDDMMLYHVARGMTSQYNEDDIRYFIDYPTEMRPIRHSRRLERIMNALPLHYLQWVPAPTTMDKIQEAMERVPV